MATRAGCESIRHGYCRTPNEELANRYDLTPLDWADVRRTLETNLTQEPRTGGPGHHTFWLSTIDADGRPHMTAAGAFWVDGRYYFCGGPRSRKIRNIEREPHCPFGVAVHGYDVALEGRAARVTDDARLQRLCRGVRRRRLGAHGRRRWLHPRIQCPQRRLALMVRLRVHAPGCLCGGHQGARWRHPMDFLKWSGAASRPTCFGPEPKGVRFTAQAQPCIRAFRAPSSEIPEVGPLPWHGHHGLLGPKPWEGSNVVHEPRRWAARTRCFERVILLSGPVKTYAPAAGGCLRPMSLPSASATFATSNPPPTSVGS